MEGGFAGNWTWCGQKTWWWEKLPTIASKCYHVSTDNSLHNESGLWCASGSGTTCPRKQLLRPPSKTLWVQIIHMKANIIWSWTMNTISSVSKHGWKYVEGNFNRFFSKELDTTLPGFWYNNELSDSYHYLVNFINSKEWFFNHQQLWTVNYWIECIVGSPKRGRRQEIMQGNIAAN